LEHCNAFKELNVSQRNAYIKDRGQCFHCLDGKHRVRDCTVREGIKCPVNQAVTDTITLCYTLRQHKTLYNTLGSQKKKDHLKDLTFPALPEDKHIYLLIGNNYPGCFVPEKIVKGKSFHDPLGYLTPFGWTVLGGNRRKYELLEKKSQEELATSYRFSLFTRSRSYFD
jgi:hypothetical protein